VFSDTLIIEIDENSDRIIRNLRIFDKEIILKDFDFCGAFEYLHKEIKEKYTIKICAFCKKSSWNPYGGVDFFNHLCFNEFSEEYNKLDVRNKNNISYLMNKNIEKYKNVYLIGSCNDYEE
jgi:hypothetical protein